MFYILSVGSNGDVYPCGANGLPLSFSIGNCRKEYSLRNLWDSDARYSLIWKLLNEGISKTDVCNICDCNTGLGYDNVDEYIEEIITKLESVQPGGNK